MKASQQHVVYYRDVKGGPLLIFGPFVSERIAAEFCDELPQPENGAKSTHPVSMFDHNEADKARDAILRRRQH